MGGRGSGRHVSAETLLLREIAERYKLMLQWHPKPFCWACGAGSSLHDKPRDWWGPWLIERAHIVRNPRREDPRAVVLLCSYCHRVSHGELIFCARYPRWPQLTREHLLWLKRERDPENYDRAFLQQNSIRKLPLAHRPPQQYLDEYQQRRGRFYEVSI